MSYTALRYKGSTAIEVAILKILRTAARVYVLEAYKHIPVDTGMSRGTLVPLAHAVGVNIPISPKRSTPAKNAGAGANKSFASIGPIGNNNYAFEWSTSVFQYYLNERFPLRSNYNAPWKSLKQGSLKVKQFLRSTKPEIARAIKRSWTREQRSL